MFSLTLWPIIEEIESKIPNLTQHCWHLDDGIIARTEPELNGALDIMTVSGKTCGIELRRDICEIWSKGARNTIDSRIKRDSREGLEILGAAVGSPDSLLPRYRNVFKRSENYLRTWSIKTIHSVLLAFYVVAWVHQKWCIHCAAIHHQRKL